jgi:hypothetical protein
MVWEGARPVSSQEKKTLSMMTPFCTIFRQFAIYSSSFNLFRFQNCMNIEADTDTDADERETIQKSITKRTNRQKRAKLEHAFGGDFRRTLVWIPRSS